MPYYKLINLLFIHIPKTGGTVIEDAIKKNGKYGQETLYTAYPRNHILPAPFSNCSLQHQFYSTIYNYRSYLNVDFNNIKVFSVVRNPYDRIISDLFFLGLITPNISKEEVFDIIKNKYIYKKNGEMHNYDNHNVPQYLYVTNDKGELINNIKIFRTETLNEDNDELNKFAGIDIDIKRNNVNKDYSKYLNNDSILFINEIYKKDFELFGYKMIT